MKNLFVLHAFCFMRQVRYLHAALLQGDLEDIRADAFLVIFSIAHRDTFDTAVQLLQELRMDLGTDRTTILVGNKSDLVRKRKVTTEGQCLLRQYTHSCQHSDNCYTLVSIPIIRSVVSKIIHEIKCSQKYNIK